MNNYYLGLYEKALPPTLSFKEKLSAAKQCGFDFLEISIDESDEKQARLDWSNDEILELKKTCCEENMPILTMCLSGSRKYTIGSTINETCDKGIELIRKAIDFAAKLGIRIVQLAGYDVYYNEQSTHTTRGRFFYNLKKCVRYASKQGVIIGLETMENHFMNTVQKAMFYVNEINSPYLKVYPDTGNITNGGVDIVKDILSGKGHIAAAHLKETSPGVFREVPFGEGHVDFDTAIKTYQSIGVSMFLAEFWYSGNEDWIDDTKFAYEFLSSKLNNLAE